jgi:hypothetical protein
MAVDAGTDPLAALLASLRHTEAGRSFGLTGVRSSADLRESVPLMDAATHLETVEGRLGFAGEGTSSPEAPGERERGRLVAHWRGLLSQADSNRPAPERVGVFTSPADDPQVDRMRWRDLSALGAVEVDRIEGPRTARARGLETLVQALRSWGGDTLLLPSLSTCSWLEAHFRAPIERALPGLRWLLVEHDFDRRVRSRVPAVNAGWLHAAGRIGIPALRPPHSSFCLATDSCVIELLPESDAQADPRHRVLASTIEPARAIMGERYEIVVSSALGYLRLRTGEHVRVVGFTAPDNLVPGGSTSPRPRVVRLHPPPDDVRLEGVTLAGSWLTAAVRQAFRPEDPALVAAEIGPDPGAVPEGDRETYSRSMMDPFADTELGASRHRARRSRRGPRALFVRVELQGESDLGITARLSSRIDQALWERSAAYAYLRDNGELWDPRVMVADPGTARRGREARLFARAHRVEVPSVRVVALT